MTVSSTAPPDSDSASGTSASTRRFGPAHVAALLTVVACSATMTGPIRDIDLPWHILIGREILETGRIGGLGNAWSLYDGGQGWITTQWASEVIIAWIDQVFGWTGFLIARLVIGAALLLLTARLCFRHARPWIATSVLIAISITLVSAVQERPNLATLLFTVWLSGAAAALWFDGRRTPPWLVLGAVALWANLHGGWILAPCAFALVAAAASLPPRRRDVARDALVATGAALIGACLTPLGLKALATPLWFVGRTSHLEEWQRTTVAEVWAAGLVLSVLILVVVWARSPSRASWGLLLICGVWAAFGFTVFRNVTPAVIMLVPFVARALDAAIPPRPPKNIDRGLVVVATVATLVSGAVMALGQLIATDPLDKVHPFAIGAELDELGAQRGERLRVLNEYNASGALAYSAPDHVALAVDGRADRFAPEWIDEIQALHAAQGDVEARLATIDPDAVVTSIDSALEGVLIREKGWTRSIEDGEFVLLLPPSRPTEG